MASTPPHPTLSPRERGNAHFYRPSSAPKEAFHARTPDRARSVGRAARAGSDRGTGRPDDEATRRAGRRGSADRTPGGSGAPASRAVPRRPTGTGSEPDLRLLPRRAPIDGGRSGHG